MKLKISLALLSVLFVLNSFATHIVGGNLTYEHLGGSSFRVTLRLYKDCRSSYFDPGSGTWITPVDFDNTARIEVRLGDGTLPACANNTLDFIMPRIGRDTLNPPIDTCAFDPGICVEEALYSSVVSLPPRSEGYHLFYRTNARNFTLDNVVATANQAGETFNTYIPNTALLLTNSSPVFANFPPVFVCAATDLDFDNSATDADGDSLVYSLYHPYDGLPWGSGGHCAASVFPTIVNNGNAPYNITYPTVSYYAGYTVNNPLNGAAFPNDTLWLEPTGILHGIPRIVGQYVVGVKVEEFRDGVKIGEIVRDFQFNVVVCPPPQNAGIGPVVGCGGTAVQFVNESGAGANDFWWDFGTGNPADTSILDNPSFTYPGFGNYPVTLIAQKGTNCADTAYYTIPISDVNAQFTYNDSACVVDIFNFQDASTVESNATITNWYYNFGDAGTAIIPDPSHTYTAGGDFTVTLVVESSVGCLDTVMHDIYAQPLPMVSVGPDTNACFNNPVINLSGIVSGAAGGIWVGSGGTFTPGNNFLNVQYDPDTSETNAGSSQLILTTQGNGFCPAQVDTLNIVYVPGPVVDAGSNQSVCQDSSYVPVVSTIQYAGGVEWTTAGDGSFDDAFADSTVYYPGTADTTAGSVWIYATTTNNGNCIAGTDSMQIIFFLPPTVDILSVDSICTGYPIDLDGQSTTGSGVWLTSGDGVFNPSDTGNVVTYVPGSNDESNGSVSIYFSSINNGGCQVQYDTVNVVILASPQASFTSTEVCQEFATDFTNTSTSQDPIASYDWTFEAGQTSTAMNPSHIFSDGGFWPVELIVTSQNGCKDTVIDTVIVQYLPDIDFGPSTPCFNGGTQYLDSTVQLNGVVNSWMWDFGDGFTSTEENPLHQYSAPGNYNVTLIVISDFGCTDTITKNYDIYPGPDAAFTVNPTSAGIQTDITFTDISQSNFPIVDWYWDYNDGNSGTDSVVSIHQYAEGWNYQVMMVVTDENGCIDTAYNNVVIFVPPVVPTGFSPNGDGNNDRLFVYGGPYKEFEFVVYNNWGERIYQSNNIQDGWDGMYKGAEQPIGVYVWTARVVAHDDQEFTLKGDVTLIR
ncbi:MAG: PKD domain-containing protein [Crocinitomicaceae bacterium]|nr:PKD domain-containing protein [Crocinitomicaceae bacterium]